MPVCPFCRPSQSDIIVLSSDGINVLCDSRPIVVGHLLIASRSHIPSMLDLPEKELSVIRYIEQRLRSVVGATFGEAGTYEHGRSAVCRFGLADAGHTHAHVHVLPVSFNLIGMTHRGSACPLPPPTLRDDRNTRYLYQSLGMENAEEWAEVRSTEVPRHFVRLAVQQELTRRGTKWLPIGADPVAHEDAVAETAAIARRYLRG